MVHYGLNKIKLDFGAQCKIVILTLFSHLLGGLGLVLGFGLGLEDHRSGLGLGNASLKVIVKKSKVLSKP